MQPINRRLMILLLLSVALLGCQSRAQPTHDATVESALRDLSSPLNCAEIEQFMGFAIPAEATNVHTQGEAALDTMVIARFDLPASALDAWLTNVPITEVLHTKETLFATQHAPYPEAEAWWQLDTLNLQPEQYRYVYQFVNGKSYKILVVQLQPSDQLLTIYLQVFNT
ncbi:hypothetical protein [Herpetosiphon giganteus]|uniref:hypothetical protein n=1 Tax=Herpetosiphon giganteus TaxID=2029754 RepID=UPI001958C8F9|nr:hypothetical protein [Herpetosiphon giganteus]MBM7844138.1 hypothetical protein [Herpetosiphon giganteus]